MEKEEDFFTKDELLAFMDSDNIFDFELHRSRLLDYDEGDEFGIIITETDGRILKEKVYHHIEFVACKIQFCCPPVPNYYYAYDIHNQNQKDGRTVFIFVCKQVKIGRRIFS